MEARYDGAGCWASTSAGSLLRGGIMIQGLDPATIIALCAFVTVLGLIFNMLLAPVKAEQKELKNGQVRFEADLKELQKGQVRFEADLKELQKGQVRLEDKIDLLLKEKK